MIEIKLKYFNIILVSGMRYRKIFRPSCIICFFSFGAITEIRVHEPKGSQVAMSGDEFLFF